MIGRAAKYFARNNRRPRMFGSQGKPSSERYWGRPVQEPHVYFSRAPIKRPSMLRIKDEQRRYMETGRRGGFDKSFVNVRDVRFTSEGAFFAHIDIWMYHDDHDVIDDWGW